MTRTLKQAVEAFHLTFHPSEPRTGSPPMTFATAKQLVPELSGTADDYISNEHGGLIAKSLVALGRIDPTAFTGQAIVYGEHTQIGKDVKLFGRCVVGDSAIGDFALLKDTSVKDQSHVGPHTKIWDSTIVRAHIDSAGFNTYTSIQRAKLENCLIGKGAHICSADRDPTTTLIDCVVGAEARISNSALNGESVGAGVSIADRRPDDVWSRNPRPASGVVPAHHTSTAGRSQALGGR